MFYETEATYSSFLKCSPPTTDMAFPSVNPMKDSQKPTKSMTKNTKKTTNTMTKTLDYDVSNIWVYGRQYQKHFRNEEYVVSAS